LAAQHGSALLVTLGTTLGMMVSDGLAVFLGERLSEQVNMKYLRWFAAALFAVFGIVILAGV
jgi:putative Ca2+/H+ antiporter (TMEM165/GDT1 family)